MIPQSIRIGQYTNDHKAELLVKRIGMVVHVLDVGNMLPELGVEINTS